MALNILKLKKQAVAEGMPKADAMKADRKALEAFINNAGEKPAKVSKKKSVAKKSTKKATAKKSTKAAPKSSTKKQTRKPAKRSENTDGFGRLNIGSIDWSAESDDWNPKKGGPVERLFKALKSSKGDVDKALAKVAGDVGDFVGKTKRDGTKRTKEDRLAMLRYRLNRTKFEFAVRTGQHESAAAENRAAYGTGDYATVRKAKPARKASTKKASTKKAKSSTKKSASKKSSTKKGGKKLKK